MTDTLGTAARTDLGDEAAAVLRALGVDMPPPGDLVARPAHTRPGGRNQPPAPPAAPPAAPPRRPPPHDWCCPDCGVREKIDFEPVGVTR
nr:hypothetical protein [Nocardia farcinica]